MMLSYAYVLLCSKRNCNYDLVPLVFCATCVAGSFTDALRALPDAL